MSKGFGQDNTETKIAIIVKRLKPSADRQDLQAFEAGMKTMASRYGGELLEAALLQLSEQSYWLRRIVAGHAMEKAQEMGLDIESEAYSFMAEQLEKAGVPLAQNFRVCDEGFQLTRAAFEALDFRGNSALASQMEAGIAEELQGLSRPYIHPLSESKSDPQDPDNELLNSYAAASFIVNVACEFYDDNDNGDGWDKGKAMENIAGLIAPVAPTLDLKELIRRAKYDDRALTKFVSLTAQGIDAAAAAKVA